MLLTLENLNASYGFLQVLRDVSLKIDRGEYVCLIGPNGAGKSTTLKVTAGILRPLGGEVIFEGERITGLRGDKVARRGIAYISEEANLFPQMTIKENLNMGAYTMRGKKSRDDRFGFVYDLFPRLKEREKQLAGTLSGGERKMLAIGRGMMLGPRLFLIDEPSFGLAPQLVDSVFESINVLRLQGATIMLVEQNVAKALSVTDRGYVLENGRIILQNTSANLANDSHVRTAFLGV